MADTYTSNLDLTLMARGDRNWDATLNAILTTLDAQQALGALAVRPAEDGPSTSLNVKISAGTFRKSDGTAVAVAAVTALALAASSTSSVYLTDAGVVTASTSGFPAATSIVPLAVVTTGTGTVTAIADARRPLTSFGAAVGGGGGDPVTATGTTTPRSLADRFAEELHCMDFGAVGDNVADDTAAIQAWSDACALAGALAVWDRPPVGYRITDTILIRPPQNGSQVHMGMDCLKAYPGLIRWAGGDNKPVLRAVGWKRSRINNISISIPDGATGVTAFDIDNTGAAPSTSHLEFDTCRVDIGTGATACHGWRLGHGSEWVTGTDGDIDQNGDISYLSFVNCSVNGTETGGGNAAWRSEHQNVLNNCWYNGSASFVDRAISNVPSPGAAASGGKGGQAIYTYGFGTSHNLVDFEYATVGSYDHFAGRFEVGTTLVKVPDVGNAAGMAILFSGAEIGGYDLAGGNVFDINSSVNLHLDGVTAYANTTLYNSGFIKLTSGAGVPGNLHLTNCLVAGSNPFHTVTAGSGPWTVRIDQCHLIDTLGVVTGTLDYRTAELAAKADLSVAALKDADNTFTGSNTFSTYTNFDSIGIGGSSSLKLNVDGTSDAVTHVTARFSSAASGAGSYFQMTDGALWNLGVGGSGGGFEVWTNRFPGNAGTLIFSVTSAGIVTGNGSGLTNLNASNLASGTVATARLGSGTANGTTFLRGDGTWAVPAGGSGGSATVWRNGTGAPANTLGVDGDYYLDDATGDVYQRSSGAYAIVANIEGPQGLQGIQGPAGTNGTNGQGVPVGGTTGQVLSKIDGTDYNTEWSDPTAGGASDLLSTLTSAPVSVTAATALDATAFGKMHVCSGTTANYAVTLPDPTGNAGKLIGFRMAPGLTKLVTVAQHATDTLDGAASRVMWASEVAILVTDGTDWFKVAGKSIPMQVLMRRHADATLDTATETKATLDTIDSDNTGLMGDTTNGRVNILRPGTYTVNGGVLLGGSPTGGMGQDTNTEAIIRVNNVDTKSAAVSNLTGGYPAPSAIYTPTLAAGDAVELYGYQESGATARFYPDNCTLNVVELPTW